MAHEKESGAEFTAEQHLKLAEEQIRLYLALAGEILFHYAKVQRWVEDEFHLAQIKSSERHRVLIGLSLKAVGAFDRLVLDAREKRGECSHHLKTMAECFIYWIWVSGDLTDTRARLLRAKSYQSMVTYHKNFSNAPEQQSLAAGWTEELDKSIKGIEGDWKRFKNRSIQEIAAGTKVEETYQRVYRFACAAAHLADLFEYTPPYPTEPGLRTYDMSVLRTFVTLGYGIHLALDFIENLARPFKLGLEDALRKFRERKDYIEHELPRGEFSSPPAN